MVDYVFSWTIQIGRIELKYGIICDQFLSLNEILIFLLVSVD